MVTAPSGAQALRVGGWVERPALPIVAGLLLMGAALGFFGAAFQSAFQSAWARIGVIPPATGLAGRCPLHAGWGA